MVKLCINCCSYDYIYLLCDYVIHLTFKNERFWSQTNIRITTSIIALTKLRF